MVKKWKVLFIISITINVFALTFFIWQNVQQQVITQDVLKSNVIDELFQIHDEIEAAEANDFANVNSLMEQLYEASNRMNEPAIIGEVTKTLSATDVDLLMELSSIFRDATFGFTQNQEVQEATKLQLSTIKNVLAQQGFDDESQFTALETEAYLHKVVEIIFAMNANSQTGNK